MAAEVVSDYIILFYIIFFVLDPIGCSTRLLYSDEKIFLI